MMDASTVPARPWARRPAAVLLIALGLAALGLGHAAGKDVVGSDAPDFALRSLAGPNVRLSEQRGDVVVVAFWSSRCNPCRTQLAELDRLYATYRPAGFVAFAVNVDDDAAKAREFALAQHLQIPMLFDPSKAVARAYRVDALPMLFAIDRFGKVRFISRSDKPAADGEYLGPLRKLIDE